MATRPLPIISSRLASLLMSGTAILCLSSAYAQAPSEVEKATIEAAETAQEALQENISEMSKDIVEEVSPEMMTSSKELTEEMVKASDMEESKDMTAITTEEEALEAVENMQTEEEFAETFINYQAPPNSTDVDSLFNQQMLDFPSEVDLVIHLNAIESEVAKCQQLRSEIESRIGDRPGSYNVNIGWVKSYQNCLVQRRNEMDRLLKSMNKLQTETLSNAGDEGATTAWDLIAKLNARFSEVRLALNSEFRTQASFVEYYNTGVKVY